MSSFRTASPSNKSDSPARDLSSIPEDQQVNQEDMSSLSEIGKPEQGGNRGNNYVSKRHKRDRKKKQIRSSTSGSVEGLLPEVTSVGASSFDDVEFNTGIATSLQSTISDDNSAIDDVPEEIRDEHNLTVSALKDLEKGIYHEVLSTPHGTASSHKMSPRSVEAALLGPFRRRVEVITPAVIGRVTKLATQSREKMKTLLKRSPQETVTMMSRGNTKTPPQETPLTVDPRDTQKTSSTTGPEETDVDPATFAMHLVSNACQEAGNKYPLFSKNLSAEIKMMFERNGIGTWREIRSVQYEWTTDQLQEAFEKIVHAYFPTSRHKESIVRVLIVKSLVQATVTVSVLAQKDSPSYVVNSDVRLFRSRAFVNGWVESLKLRGIYMKTEEIEALVSEYDAGKHGNSDHILPLLFAEWNGTLNEHMRKLLDEKMDGYYEILKKQRNVKIEEDSDTFSELVRNGRLRFNGYKDIQLTEDPFEAIRYLFQKTFMPIDSQGATPILTGIQEMSIRQILHKHGGATWTSLLYAAGKEAWNGAIKGDLMN